MHSRLLLVCLRHLMVGLTFAALASAAGGQDLPSAATETTSEAGGTHVRLHTGNGSIHVWRPDGYDAQTAGVVVYIHGYHTSIDQAWTEHHLAEQFQASGRNALFIAPEASQFEDDPIKWESLGELLNVVREIAGLPLPRGPVVVAGHSGAYRTIVAWLPHSHITCLIMLDALYRKEQEFRAWLRGPSDPPTRRIILVGYETAKNSDRFARRSQGGRRRAMIPEDVSQFSKQERQARVLYLRSQYDHMELVTGGKVIPLLLRLTSLRPV
jgi:hypothetical protein